MSLFNDYESEFKQTVNLIKEKIIEWKASKKQTIATQIQNELDVAKDALENMNHVVRSTHNGDSLKQKVKTYESSLESVIEEWERARLLSDPNREKLAGGMATLKRTSDRLAEIDRLGLESEEIGTAAAERLRSDNVKLEMSYMEMTEIGSNVTLSRSILSRMTRRAIYSKLILTIIIVVELLAIIIIIGVKWIRPLLPHSTTGPTMAPTLAPTFSPTLTPTGI